MKPSLKFSILGCLVGSLLTLGTVLITDWQMDKRSNPALNTQVLDYLQSRGFPIDTLANNRYSFVMNEEHIIFEYFPTDEGFLRFFTFYDASDYSYEELETVIEATNTTKNCYIMPKRMDDGSIWIMINVESFINKREMLDTDIIDRTLSVISGASIDLLRQLGRL